MLTKTVAESKTNKNPNQNKTLGVVAHTYHPSTTESDVGTDESSRAIWVNSRPAWITHCDPVSKAKQRCSLKLPAKPEAWAWSAGPVVRRNQLSWVNLRFLHTREQTPTSCPLDTHMLTHIHKNANTCKNNNNKNPKEQINKNTGSSVWRF